MATTEMVDYECEYYKVRVPAKSCLLCEWCTDVFWDYFNGPYMTLCYHNADTSAGGRGECDLFEPESNDEVIESE